MDRRRNQMGQEDALFGFVRFCPNVFLLALSHSYVDVTEREWGQDGGAQISIKSAIVGCPGQ
jgi:hypothetical protein